MKIQQPVLTTAEVIAANSRRQAGEWHRKQRPDLAARFRATAERVERGA